VKRLGADAQRVMERQTRFLQIQSPRRAAEMGAG
jgi:hypothetical protein